MKKILLATALLLGSTLAISLQAPSLKVNVHKDGTTDSVLDKPTDDFGFDNSKTPEERVAKVAVDKTEDFKMTAKRAAKEAEVSKTVSDRAMHNAHAFQKQASEAK